MVDLLRQQSINLLQLQKGRRSCQKQWDGRIIEAIRLKCQCFLLVSGLSPTFSGMITAAEVIPSLRPRTLKAPDRLKLRGKDEACSIGTVAKLTCHQLIKNLNSVMKSRYGVVTGCQIFLGKRIYRAFFQGLRWKSELSRL